MQNDPTSNSLLASIITARRATDNPATLPITPAEATAQVMALLCAPSDTMQSAKVWTELKRRNDALTTAPKAEIRETLARQTALLEAMQLRFTQLAVTASKTSQTEVWTRLSLSCSRALVSVLGALNTIADSEVQAEAIEHE